MIKILSIIIGIVFVILIAILCFFSCILSAMSDDYWEEVKKRLEGKK